MLFDGLPRPIRLLLAIVLVGVVGMLDFWTGVQVSLSFFYLLPVALTAWSLGRSAGLAASLVSATAWLVANHLAGDPLAGSVVFLWNAGIRLGFFAVFAVLLAQLRAVLDRERMLSRTDHLTDALNTRAFTEAANAELDRSRRYGHSLALAYVDLDNFKSVNDRFGHSTGDALLQAVVRTIRACIRRTDTIARLGGDEFGILMPETDADAARRATENLRTNVLEAMRARGWPVTISVGVLTCLEVPESVDALVSRADALMYDVKRATKDGVAYAVYEERGVPSEARRSGTAGDRV